MDESMSFSASPSCSTPTAVFPNVHRQSQPSSQTLLPKAEALKPSHSLVFPSDGLSSICLHSIGWLHPRLLRANQTLETQHILFGSLTLLYLYSKLRCISQGNSVQLLQQLLIGLWQWHISYSYHNPISYWSSSLICCNLAIQFPSISRLCLPHRVLQS